MYEALTALLPSLSGTEYGEWMIDQENDGTPERPIQMPYVEYSRAVNTLEREIYAFMDEHPELLLNCYSDILAANGITWSLESMKEADVEDLDGRTVMALLVGAIRAERFCDGALLEFCESGSVTRWLERLERIDRGK